MNRNLAVAKDSQTLTLALHTLGWRNFQDLCGAVLSKVLGQSFAVFADSNDGGRDGAFYGNWSEKRLLANLTGIAKGATVLQCKFTAQTNVTLSLSGIADELDKIPKLVAKGICENYILMTNAKVTGAAEEKIRKAILDQGVKRVYILDGSWVCSAIRQNQALRLYVPRVYGLGDLSQILDKRANEQAQELIDQLDGFSTFVVTGAYRKAANAIRKNGFVMLLGEPSSGKSVIAATLAMASVDRWDSLVVRVSSAQEFRDHWNPGEPNQFFWVDDVFGAVRHDESLTDAWSKALPEVMAAINKGAKVIMTSRDYIYRSAKPLLKEYAYPLLKENQVVINVSRLSREEKQKMLYNHIKRGSQSTSFKKEIKPYLTDIADTQKFLPEVARRLGDRVFTKKLDARSKQQVLGFMENPTHYLMDVFLELDPHHRAALALVYKYTRLLSPIKLSAIDKELIERLGAEPSRTRQALSNLEQTFLRYNKGKSYWSFHHPTLKEGFARFIMSDPELVDVVIDGLSLNEIMEQVDCGSSLKEGQLLRIPSSGYGHVLGRFEGLHRLYEEADPLSKYFLRIKLFDFLKRSSKSFLKMFLRANPEFMDTYVIPSLKGGILGNGAISLLGYMQDLDLLTDSVRCNVVTYFTEVAVSVPDSNWLTWRPASKLVLDAEKELILEEVKNNVVNQLDDVINTWEQNEDTEDETYYDNFRESLVEYMDAFDDDEGAQVVLSQAIDRVDELMEEHARASREIDDDSLYDDSHAAQTFVPMRSIFDDIDQ